MKHLFKKCVYFYILPPSAFTAIPKQEAFANTEGTWSRGVLVSTPHPVVSQSNNRPTVQTIQVTQHTSLSQLWTKPWGCWNTKQGKWHREQVPGERREQSTRPWPHFAKMSIGLRCCFQSVLLRVINPGSFLKDPKPDQEMQLQTKQVVFFYCPQRAGKGHPLKKYTLQNMHPLRLLGGKKAQPTRHKKRKWSLEEELTDACMYVTVKFQDSWTGKVVVRGWVKREMGIRTPWA